MAALGRQVSLRLLKQLWEGDGDLMEHLQELQQHEFLYEQSGAAEPLYVFKHVLTQEVAYESLLVSDRRALHAVAGQALETLYADSLAEVYDQLAYHYTRTDHPAKAVLYLTHMADRAMRECAYTEAVGVLQETLRQLERLSVEAQHQHLPVVELRFVDALHYLGRFQESLDVLRRQQARVAQVQDGVLVGVSALQLGFTYSMLGDHESAMQHTRLALDRATAAGEKTTMGKAHYVMALEGYWLGQPRQGLAHGQQAIALLERTSERLALGMAYVYTGINHTLMGDFGAALDAVARARGHGAVIGDPSLQSYVTWLTGWIQAMRGEWEQSIATCQHCLERSPHPLHTALALSTLGYAYVETHQPQQALPLLEQAAEYMRQFQHRPLHGWAITLLAEAQRLQGHLGLAYDLARQGLSLTSEAAYRLGIGMAQRALGRIAQANHDLIAAETSCTQALATFAAIPAHYELARTHLDLAAFAHAQKQPATTIHHLHEAHARFASLHIPVYMARTMALAEACGVPLPAP